MTTTADRPNRRSLRAISTVRALEEDLSGRILNGELKPGEGLREIQLSEEYGVGRHTVREAFQRLASAGLVVLEPNRGASVPLFTRTDIEEIYWVRAELEEAVARLLAASATPPLEAVRELKRFFALPADAPWRYAVDVDLSFHQALVAALGNSRLDRIYQTLSAEMRLCIAQLRPHYGSTSDLAAEHAEILTAITSGDLELASKAVRDHFARAVADITRDHPRLGEEPS